MQPVEGWLHKINCQNSRTEKWRKEKSEFEQVTRLDKGTKLPSFYTLMSLKTWDLVIFIGEK
jgi:hypothetical protein